MTRSCGTDGAARPRSAAEAGVDIGGAPDQDLDMAGRVEAAIRAAVPLDVPLRTPSGRGRFTVTRYTSEGLAEYDHCTYVVPDR